MGTMIIALLVAGVAALAIRSILRSRKSGKSISCGGNCRACSNSSLCHLELPSGKAPKNIV